MRIKYYWSVLSLMTGTMLALSFVNQGIAALTPFWVSDLGVTRGQAGFLGVTTHVGMTLTLLVTGILVDLLGEKAVLAGGCLLTGLTMLTVSQTHSFATLAVFLMLAGFWTAVATPAGSRAIISWFPAGRTGLAMGVHQTGTPLGGFLSALLLPTLASLYSWRVALIATGVPALCGALLVIALYRPSPPAPVMKRSGAGGRIPRKIMASGDFWMIACTAFILAGIQFAFTVYLVLFCHEYVGMPVQSASYMLVLSQLVSIAGRIFWGLASDSFFGGSRQRPFMIIALLATAICLAMLFLRPGTPWWVVALLSCMIGFILVGWGGLFVATVSEISPGDNTGTALSISLMMLHCGAIVIPPLFGAVVDYTGSYRYGWIFLTALSLVGIFFVGRLREPASRVRCSSGS